MLGRNNLHNNAGATVLQIYDAMSPTLKMLCCRFVAPFSNRKTSSNLTLMCNFLDLIVQTVWFFYLHSLAEHFAIV